MRTRLKSCPNPASMRVRMSSSSGRPGPGGALRERIGGTLCPSCVCRVGCRGATNSSILLPPRVETPPRLALVRHERVTDASRVGVDTRRKSLYDVPGPRLLLDRDLSGSTHWAGPPAVG